MEDLTGRTLGDYHVYRRLGRGAMATVYLARQLSLDRQVALKVLNADLAVDASYVARFQNEARAAAALVHPNIVQVYEVGVTDGHRLIAQEYVAGDNVGKIIKRQGRLDAGPTLDILRQVAAALCRAAEAGIVHRDIKPENLMLSPAGEVKVADFGLARAEQGGVDLTQAGVTMGTPLYMSPEQVEGKTVDARSDLYSLGVTAYHMLAGAPPFAGQTPLAVAVQHLNSDPPPLLQKRPDLSAPFGELVMRLMQKRPDDRPQGPAELLAELRALAADAANEGWAASPENWPLHESMAVETVGASDAARLSRLMATSARLRESPGRSRLGLGLAIATAALAGGLLAWTTRPSPVLSATPLGPTQKENVLQQIFHAKLLDTEEAWKAVPRLFPEALEFYHHQAAEGLARHYLTSERHDRARPLCAKLASLDDQAVFKRFGYAGLVICDTATGETQRAERILDSSRLIEALPEIQRSDPVLHGLIQQALRKLRKGPSAGPDDRS